MVLFLCWWSISPQWYYLLSAYKNFRSMSTEIVLESVMTVMPVVNVEHRHNLKDIFFVIEIYK
jgi:hypothetical protein